MHTGVAVLSPQDMMLDSRVLSSPQLTARRTFRVMRRTLDLQRLGLGDEAGLRPVLQSQQARKLRFGERQGFLGLAARRSFNLQVSMSRGLCAQDTEGAQSHLDRNPRPPTPECRDPSGSTRQ